MRHTLENKFFFFQKKKEYREKIPKKKQNKNQKKNCATFKYEENIHKYAIEYATKKAMENKNRRVEQSINNSMIPAKSRIKSFNLLLLLLLLFVLADRIYFT